MRLNDFLTAVDICEKCAPNRLHIVRVQFSVSRGWRHRLPEGGGFVVEKSSRNTCSKVTMHVKLCKSCIGVLWWQPNILNRKSLSRGLSCTTFCLLLDLSRYANNCKHMLNLKTVHREYLKKIWLRNWHRGIFWLAFQFDDYFDLGNLTCIKYWQGFLELLKFCAVIRNNWIANLVLLLLLLLLLLDMKT